MFLNGIGTATPPGRYTKADCWRALEQSDWLGRLDPVARVLVRRVLLEENGMEARRLALDRLTDVFQIDPETLHRRFLTHAPALAASAGERALADARLAPRAVDAVIVSTCTGYLCPGLSGHMIERLGLREDVQALDLVGQGCVAALPNMRAASALLDAGAARHVLSICVEVSSAAMYLDSDPGVLISACLFGDGAGAALLSQSGVAHRRRMLWRDSESLIDTSQRTALMFEQRHGMLRNVLTRAVPGLAAEGLERVLAAVLARNGVGRAQIRAWILHAGGRDVLDRVQRRLGLDARDLAYSAATLREYGNLSSAFVYFVLQAALAAPAPGGLWWLSSFGAGFSCQAALLEIE